MASLNKTKSKGFLEQDVIPFERQAGEGEMNKYKLASSLTRPKGFLSERSLIWIRSCAVNIYYNPSYMFSGGLHNERSI